MKAGFIGKELQAPVGLVSAWAELGGYCANISLNALRIRALLGQEARLGEHVLQLRKVRAAARSQQLQPPGPQRCLPVGCRLRRRDAID